MQKGLPTLVAVGMLALPVAGCAGEDSPGPPGTRADVPAESRIPAEVRHEPRLDTDGNILTDTFEIGVDARGDRVTVVLRTDLPDATRLMVSVDRLYQQEGDSEDYPISYFSESATVGEWRTPRVIELDHGEWRRELEDTRRIMASIGDPFSVRNIEATVEVRMTVPVNQPDPFAPRNANLRGAVVEESSAGPIIRRGVAFTAPLDGEVSAVSWADPLNLTAGRSYRISRVTPLVPDPDPADPLTAIAATVELPASTAIRVLDRAERSGILWYEVEVDRENRRRGWINSAALIGQSLEEVE